MGLEYVRESFTEKYSEKYVSLEKYMSRYKWGKMFISKSMKGERRECIPGSGT